MILSMYFDIIKIHKRKGGNMATVLERVQTIVADQLGQDKERVILAASFTEDLGADSLDLVEMIMALEKGFSREGQRVEISDEEAEKLRTIQDVVDYIKGKGIKDE